jgi:hypothetical protein
MEMVALKKAVASQLRIPLFLWIGDYYQGLSRNTSLLM